MFSQLFRLLPCVWDTVGRDAGVQRKAANPCSSSPESAFLICFKVADLKNARSETALQNSIPLFLPLSFQPNMLMKSLWAPNS